jgi:hypothetical protein
VLKLTTLDERRASVLEALSAAIVPGSTRVGPVVYIDARLTGMDAPHREAALAAIDQLAGAASEGPEMLRTHVGSSEFALVRELVIEAYYSDFVAPGLEEAGAWAEIDFNSPLATRLRKSWSYLGLRA